MPYVVDVGMALDYNPVTRELTVNLTSDFIASVSGDLRMNCVILEDNIVGEQSGVDGSYTHRHVARKYLGGAWGVDAGIPNNVNAGQSYNHQFNVTLPNDWDEEQISVVGLVQRYNGDNTQREILNAAEAKLGIETFAHFTPDVPGQNGITVIDAGESVTFTDGSGGSAGIGSWNWTFQGGTPSSSNTQGPHTITYNTPGIYDVSLTVTDYQGGSDTKTVDALIEVLDVLDANFEADITYVPIGENVAFTDISNAPTPITSWQWNFGDGATSTLQNPVHSYNSTGFYTVRLTVNDGTEANTEIKQGYIQVYDPLDLNIVDFTGTPTVINVGQSVNFDLETNLTDNNIDSVRWIFQGADVPSVYKTNTLPFNVTYSTGGIFDVEVRVYRNYGSNGDTLIKQDYITVIDPDSVPVANFSANNTNIPMGTSINFINLTSNIERLDSVRWFIETDNGTITTNDLHPSDILYNTVGDFDVQLLVYSPFGNHDTLKPGYIHVYDPDNMSDIHANFENSTVRLIKVGESVRFEDLSTGDIENWFYIFDRGAGAANLEFSTEQNPEHYFLNPGVYTVTLIASNSSYKDTLTKDSYVVVTTTNWPGGGAYCDTISSLLESERDAVYKQISGGSTWGYFPGHCALLEEGGSSTPKKIKQYAQKFTTYHPDYISAVSIPVHKAFSGDNDAVIRIRVWDADANGNPNQVISGGPSSNKIKLSSLIENEYNFIELDNPVEVDSVFFVGFRVDYKTATSPQDTFITYMSIDRGNLEDNTLYLSKNSNGGPWKTPSRYFDPDISTAIDIKLVSCVVSVPELEEIKSSLDLYPNPTTGRVQADFGGLNIQDIDIRVVDVLGKEVDYDYYPQSDAVYQIDISNNEGGFYLISFSVNGYYFTKKVLLYR